VARGAINVRIVAAHRYEALDGLRGVAALCVMACHFGQMLDVYWPANMFLAVDVFFMMSGFVIAYSYGERLRNGMPAWSYLGRRLIRLYPMFIVALLIGAGALFFGAQKDAIVYRPQDILRSLLLNSAYLPFPNGSHIGLFKGQVFPADPPAWSLFLEMLVSGGFLLLCGLRREALLAITIVSFLLIVGTGVYFARVQGFAGLQLNTGFDTATILGGPPRAAFGFTLGVLLYGFMRDGLGRRIAAAVARVPYASFALYIALFAVLACPVSARGLYGLAVLVTVAPAIIFVSACVRPRNGLEMRLARLLGWISYPVYCLHTPIMRYVMYGGVTGRNVTATLALAVSTTLLAAIVLTRWYEEPVRAVLSRRLPALRPVSLGGAE
jgi:peptidoglycan/LPS O-acetylase OafA/YrhL